ncbi:2-dehydropantoate 2-reductase [Vulcanimicrobium alpinum]|uniref:2-dehydropantoate 2-reductase n=1 Tax=Vulcanimicrobium alpinum TaxID=3016050 RepID=A0AAN1XXM9_UNVUL|nr:2-dehydropantoate 2-reductase [Vulcanimicrobium alpinum]BDE07249.1 2-dehydropantoate 2-reductase [Vulcanimicrobium alpinum]
MKIGIVGGGAIGLTFAAALARAHDVVVLVRRPELAALLARDGIALVRDDGVEIVRCFAASDPAALGGRDALIVAVKAYATSAALAPLAGILPPHALVASVQNGIDFAADARAALPHARIAAGSTTQGAIGMGPGRVRPAGAGTTVFARDDAAAPSSDALAGACTACGLPATAVDDIRPVLWRKLAINAALNPLGALARRSNGEVASDPDLAPLARRAAEEAAAVAAAEGIVLDDPWAAVEAAARATAANRNSMLQDLDAGRPTEIDAIAGALVRCAHARAIPVPLTETLLHLVRARERA